MKLETLLSVRGLSINKLAESCGISRQSVYNMFENSPVFNTTFEKIRRFLNVDFRAITSDTTVSYEILKRAPDRIKLAAYFLSSFSESSNADLLLFNSEGNDKYGPRNEWNFAVFFQKKDFDQKLMSMRQELIEKTSPYRIEIINLNRSPLWMKLIIKDRFVRLVGNTPEETLFFWN